ncbi:WecB/TagA/CpsF family glycosyltransferase [Candidatus Bipolaricaulota bacterium]|nr:WecB/TagA/CpsF family glycosyltransferase [Candidatus Bipolaricaulota bacterium]
MEVLGIPLTALSQDGFVDEVARRLAQGERGIALFTPDAWAAARAILYDDIRALYRQADLVACDGTALAWAARVGGHPLPRVAGVDLAWALCARGTEVGWSAYLLGGRPGVAAAAARRVRAAFPGLRIVGTHHGYFAGDGPVREIRRLQPDLLLVALGHPKQERWILAHRDLGAGLLMGVGGTLDLWAGRFCRAPRAWQRLGLEWLWRAAQDPRRVRRLWAVPFLLYHIGLGWTRCRGKRG